MSRVNQKLINELLQNLGFQSVDDVKTVVPLDAFERLSADAVVLCCVAHDVDAIAFVSGDAETKFELVNRVLALRYGKIIDNTKQLDELPDGFKIEYLPC